MRLIPPHDAASGEFWATYEAASVRKFLHGRTACTRSLSTGSRAWVLAMETEGDRTPDRRRLDLLRKAADMHVEYTRSASEVSLCQQALRLVEDRSCLEALPGESHITGKVCGGVRMSLKFNRRARAERWCTVGFEGREAVVIVLIGWCHCLVPAGLSARPDGKSSL